MRNPDRQRWPNAAVVDFPILFNEDARCSLREEYDSFEGLPYQEEWDLWDDGLSRWRGSW